MHVKPTAVESDREEAGSAWVVVELAGVTYENLSFRSTVMLAPTAVLMLS